MGKLEELRDAVRGDLTEGLDDRLELRLIGERGVSGPEQPRVGVTSPSTADGGSHVPPPSAASGKFMTVTVRVHAVERHLLSIR
jgi:hypothetical protein